MSRSLLLVAQLAPPSNLIAARRVAGLAKYLARAGHRINVITSAASGVGPITGAQRVDRTYDLLASSLNWRRSHFDALAGGSQAYSRPSRLEAVVVPDLALVGWAPSALLRVRKLVREERPDCVLTTSPPESTHLLGAFLRRRGVPWIAELRDGWTFEPPRAPFPLQAQRSLARALEHGLLRRADRVVAVTEPIAADLRVRLGIDARVITNGFDPEEIPPRKNLNVHLDEARHSLVHTGRMGVARATPQPLFEAIRTLQRQAPEFVDRLEVVFAGPLSADERVLFDGHGLGSTIRYVGALPREEALQLQRDADSLLVVTEGATRTSVATGKLFEYLGARRPIFVLGEGTAAAKIVLDAGAGLAVPAGDTDAIACGLRQFVERSAEWEITTEDVAPYSYERIAAQVAELLADLRE